jgi:hypothetical protein
VVVDRRSYDSWGNGKLDHEFDYANATEGSTMMSTLRGRQASRASNLLESTYEWAVKMGERLSSGIGFRLLKHSLFEKKAKARTGISEGWGRRVRSTYLTCSFAYVQCTCITSTCIMRSRLWSGPSIELSVADIGRTCRWRMQSIDSLLM